MTAKLKGGIDFAQLVAALSAQIETSIARGAVRAAAKVIAEGAREECRSEEVRESIKVSSTRVEAGMVTVKVQTKGKGAYMAPWLEYGTDPHFISVDDEQSGGRTVRRINREVKRGSLVIGGAFVGKTVHHPGAIAHPFMRPALDTREAAAIVAAGEYIAARLTKAGLAAPYVEEPEE